MSVCVYIPEASTLIHLVKATLYNPALPNEYHIQSKP